MLTKQPLPYTVCGELAVKRLALAHRRQAEGVHAHRGVGVGESPFRYGPSLLFLCRACSRDLGVLLPLFLPLTSSKRCSPPTSNDLIMPRQPVTTRPHRGEGWGASKHKPA